MVIGYLCQILGYDIVSDLIVLHWCRKRSTINCMSYNILRCPLPIRDTTGTHNQHNIICIIVIKCLWCIMKLQYSMRRVNGASYCLKFGCKENDGGLCIHPKDSIINVFPNLTKH